MRDTAQDQDQAGATLCLVGMGVLDQRMLILLDIERLMSAREIGLLDALLA